MGKPFCPQSQTSSSSVSGKRGNITRSFYSQSNCLFRFQLLLSRQRSLRRKHRLMLEWIEIGDKRAGCWSQGHR